MIINEIIIITLFILINSSVFEASFNSVKSVELKESDNEFERWNISEWWKDNHELDKEGSNHYQEPIYFEHRSAITQQSEMPDYRLLSSHEGINSPSNTSDEDIDTIDLEETVQHQQEHQRPQSSSKLINPTTTVRDLLRGFRSYFSSVRSYQGDRKDYKQVQKDLKNQFFDYGLETASQSFWPPEMVRKKVKLS